MAEGFIVNPNYYVGKRFECIEVIEAFYLGFCLGNAFKCIIRHKGKGGRVDLEKALGYLRRFSASKTAQEAQREAWRALAFPGFEGVTENEIIADFSLDSHPLESAAVMILTASTSPVPKACVVTAEGYLEALLQCA